MYAKLEDDGTLTLAPRNYKKPDGRIIVNFNKSVTLMKKYGFKPLIEVPEDIESDYEILGYQDTGDEIVTLYKPI